MRFPSLAVVILMLLVAFSGPIRPATAQEATPAPAAPVAQPAQPATGPGGADLAYDGILAQHYGPQPDGTVDPTGYWLFEPTLPRTGTPEGTLPLVLCLHGVDPVDPRA